MTNTLLDEIEPEEAVQFADASKRVPPWYKHKGLGAFYIGSLAIWLAIGVNGDPTVGDLVAATAACTAIIGITVMNYVGPSLTETVLTNRRLLQRHIGDTQILQWALSDIVSIGRFGTDGSHTTEAVTNFRIRLRDGSYVHLKNVTDAAGFWTAFPDPLCDKDSDVLQPKFKKFRNTADLMMSAGLVLSVSVMAYLIWVSSNHNLFWSAVVDVGIFGPGFAVCVVASVSLGYSAALMRHRRTLTLEEAKLFAGFGSDRGSNTLKGRISTRFLPLYEKVLTRLYGTPVSLS